MSSQRVTLIELRQSWAAEPNDASRAYALGRAFAVRREYEPAVELLRRATQLDPACARYFFELGQVFRRQERWDLAIEADRAGVALAPHDAVGLTGLGRKYERVGNDVDAIHAFVRAVECAPDFGAAYIGLCRILVERRTAEHADALARERVPQTAPPVLLRVGLGRGLEWHGRYQEALAVWTRASSEHPADPDVLMGAARVHAVLGDLEAAERTYARALQLHPDSLEVVFAHIGFLYRLGRIEDLRQRIGEPEPRRLITEQAMVAQPSAAPMWDGTQTLDGRTILIECSGGYGDTFNFCRFAPLLTRRGARVIVQCPPQVAPLVRTMPGAGDVVSPFDECRPFDYQCRADFLGLLLPWTWQWIEDSIPYVSVDPAKRHAWRQRLDDRCLNVGLVWRSQVPEYRDPYINRSLPAGDYRRLARVPGVRLYGLQKGAGAGELTPQDSEWLTANWGTEFNDFSDAAAAMQALDAVVTVDTGPAHLAGALGTTAFIVLPRSPARVWMSDAPSFEQGGRCAWYPAARVYFQERPGDWTPPLTRVADDLATRCAGARSTVVIEEARANGIV